LASAVAGGFLLRHAAVRPGHHRADELIYKAVELLRRGRGRQVRPSRGEDFLHDRGELPRVVVCVIVEPVQGREQPRPPLNP